MKRNRLFQECVLFVVIVFAVTTVNFFAIPESSAHQLCSGCPADESSDTYCYDCNSEHNHIEDALDALDNEVSAAEIWLTDVESFESEVENYSTSTSEEINIKNSILGGLAGIATTVTGAVATGLSIKAMIASGGTATPLAIWTARAGIAGAVAGGAATLVNLKNAYDGMVARYKKIPCPVCREETTRAELDGWSGTSGQHAFITCQATAMGSDGSRYICNVLYRKCRVICPNAFGTHAMTCMTCQGTYPYNTETECPDSSQGHSWQY